MFMVIDQVGAHLVSRCGSCARLQPVVARRSASWLGFQQPLSRYRTYNRAKHVVAFTQFGYESESRIHSAFFPLPFLLRPSRRPGRVVPERRLPLATTENTQPLISSTALKAVEADIIHIAGDVVAGFVGESLDKSYHRVLISCSSLPFAESVSWRAILFFAGRWHRGCPGHHPGAGVQDAEGDFGSQTVMEPHGSLACD